MHRLVRVGLAALAMVSLTGIGRAQSDLESVRTQAKAGDPTALNTLGNIYANGQGVAKDDREALRYYQQAADLSYAPANFNLGMMYELGRGVTRDLTKAFDYYRKSATQGFAAAQFNVGNMYAGGIGVAQDSMESVLWFRQAADQGLAEAQYNLGLAYEIGRGVRTDAAQAITWYRLAANQGYPRAQYNLAVMLEEGRGSAKDEVNAAKLYLAAARQGFGPAQNNLGIMLAEGRGGLAVNPVDALVWLSLATENGVSPEGRDIVTKQLSAAQLTEVGKRLASIRAGASTPTQPSEVANSGPSMSPANSTIATPEQLAPLLAENEELRAAQNQADRERLEMAARLQELKAENERLSAAIANASRVQTTLPADLSTDERVKRLLEHKDRLNSEVTRSTKELSSLYRQLRVANDKLRVQSENASVGSPGESAEALAKLRDELSAVRIDNQRLAAENQRLVASASSNAEMDALRSRVAIGEKAVADLVQANQRNADLADQLQKAQVARDAALATQDELAKKLASVPAAKPNDEEIQRLNAAWAQTKADLVSTRRELEGLRVQIQATEVDAKVAVARSVKELDLARSKAADAEAYARNLEESNRNLSTKLDQLRAQARPVETKTVTAPVPDLRDELKAVRNDLSQVNERLAAMTQERDELARTATATTTQIEQLQAALRSAQSRSQNQPNPLQAKLDDSNALLAAAQKWIKTLESSNQSLEQAADDTKRELALVKEENRQLTVASRDTNSKLTMDEVAWAKLSAEIDESARVLAERDETIAKFKGQIASLQADLDSSRKATAAALAAQASAAQALPDANATRLEMQTLEGQVAQLEKQMAQERARSASELAALADQLKLASTTNKSLSDANRSLILSKNSDLESLNADQERLTKRVAELQEANDTLSKERDEQKSQVTDMFTKLSDSEQQIAALNQALIAAKSTADKATAELQGMKQKQTEVDAALDEHGTAVAELTGINQNLQSEKNLLEQRLAQVMAQAEQAKTTLAATQSQLEQQNRAVATAVATADENARKLADLQTAHDDTLSELASLQSENNRLDASSAQVAKLQADLKQVQAKLSEQENRSQSLSTMEAQLKAANANLNQQLEMTNARLDALRSENSRLAGASEALNQAENKIATLTATSAQLNGAQQDLAGMRAENARLNDTLQALERDRTSRIAALQQDNAALSARLRQAQGTLDQIASAARYINSGGTSSVPASVTSAAAPRQPTEAASAPRYHTVVQGDSLSRISLRYFGTANRWQEIYNANREMLSTENVLRPGQQLLIP